MIESLRLLNTDVLITPIEKNDVYQSELVIIEKDERREDLNFFKVLRVAKDVKLVKEGDIILLGMGRHTVPVIVGNTRVAITKEDDVEAIVEL